MFFRIPIGVGKEDDGKGREELGGSGDEQRSCWEGRGEEQANGSGELRGEEE